MIMFGCKWYLSQDNVGVCVYCLCEFLSRFVVYQDEEDDFVDLEVFFFSKFLVMLVGSWRVQFILVQYDEDGNFCGCLGVDNLDLFYFGVNRNVMGVLVGSY